MKDRTLTNSTDLKEIALLFLKLGTIAFGGPAAHIAMMEDEVVHRKKWMTSEHFLDLIGATNLIPGPNSTEMTMHCGYEKAGLKGLVVAGLSFILPAVVITGIFAWLYQRYGQLPEVEPFIYGIKPAVIAIILMAAYRLGKKAVKNRLLAILGLIALFFTLYGVNEIIVLFGIGILGLLLILIKKKSALNGFVPLILFDSNQIASIDNLRIFLSFLKIGAVLYGSGYVLFAFLDAELVSNGWLTRQVLIDAVAVGQITPGPVLTTATFIGWQMHGLSGALCATVGIFLPSFIFVYLLNPYIPKMRRSPYVSALLDAVNVAAVALILAVCIELGKESITDWRTLIIAIVSLILVFKFKKISSAYVILGSALLGYLLYLIQF